MLILPSNILLINKGYHHHVVIEWLKSTALNRGSQRIFNHTNAEAKGCVPQPHRGVQRAGQDQVVRERPLKSCQRSHLNEFKKQCIQ
ncbi:hypothetical protein AVEN_266728-1 [Araneus ventricosus]|uniref:Uncharacterized protein n=1 Tax=Araneus ventricosus TaxID=182803 RepID=A0A4Y2GV89_ARAVE|nr:hypothetical protein AVEN_266728-1 [Araneus ventricosus]